ncbi:hypothetical protein Ctob_010035 [Chrysochromulina tobinii]|uniref:Uncharacterized protein n=1 Tax=Chrysochromulina tobinii TaxID=1460289 RepID=A0A0M0KBA9_9EUKA|nr:hypothetical protein Ctob_010035 [Chrysochromulina tobinii]|eukprot:KOO35703.1 hypothetical protein Ctob_010035 [Chrysochromulina sp. CCMP291]
MPHTASAPVLPNAWVTPTTVEMGSDSIIRARSKVNKENKENHQGAAPPTTPDKASDKTRKALAELLTPTTQTRTVQQALKADPLRRWRRVGDYAAREHAKQDRITRMVADDRCAARDWLEVRASFRFGMFSSSSMSSV